MKNKKYLFILLLFIPVVLLFKLYQLKNMESYTTIVLMNEASNKEVENLVSTKKRIEVSNGLTYDELVNKINKNIKGVLSNKGEYIVNKSLEIGVDPLFITSVIIVESGCSYNCSSLASYNYNFGGIKGSNGSYMKYGSVDEGIDAVINVLYYGYISKGSKTPEAIAPKYAGGSTTWAPSVRSIMQKIKNS